MVTKLYEDDDLSYLYFPPLKSLEHALDATLIDARKQHGQLVAVNRKLNVFVSTFGSEIVDCRFEDETALRLLCKYGDGSTSNIYQHRGGVPYEAMVYREILGPSGMTSARCFGAYADAESGTTWLFLEYLGDTYQLNHTRQPRVSQRRAARWLAQFHTLNAARLEREPLGRLLRYDREYYAGWARRTAAWAGSLHQRFRWLAPLCERFESAVDVLLDGPPTIIHGEFYPTNILVRGTTVYPVDWEAAAIAADAIDVATITEDWPVRNIRACVDEYAQARWPGGVPAAFERRLAIARLYLQFRWLGDRPEWTTSPDYRWRFTRLRIDGRKAGLI